MTWAQFQALLLAVKLLQPTSGRADQVPKRRHYQE